MLRIISANLNGIRSAAKKGFLPWAIAQKADFICMQELKAQRDDLEEDILNPTGLKGYFHHAEKKGYSGCGIYTPHQPDDVLYGFGNAEFDAEGRYVEARFKKLSVISVYMPSGSSSEERQEAKFRYLEAFLPHLVKLKKSGREIVLCGDVNIAHQEIDLKNWKGNLKNSGFLPEERAWLTNLFDKVGYVDIYRRLEPKTSDECYTWWSQRGQAYAKNVGWRIDYQIATPAIAASAKKASVYKSERFSDHAPLIIDYDWSI
ncbi:exodeoxyribonuclease III [Polynucleobacter paneuropaeus]|jgi:exodeoxyribonuclease-3|uniref:Exodeoxyribonuclease III n=1 Tax=Polynucleobacter paneuropaeus TaxID=2527775 RepID=A0A2Z4JUP6_9BURK|nr:exodeoxyribonuclease III [Polynucleobacter paneuropaeus]AWW48670.1 exodeoxyribonuclease III [Polynucleobacter paneuropaeus]AWW50506.1 exodeoxyribonuclease III [Polynucleobacter paneuropaeus]MBT8517523.1 exodeoxyribonuclease III [Polynucleobacter paneuropaeus]MBT8520395.1 exodeoxyribonuclease III [Polynucleobacter paneuropaeus]MBT8521684.1 exodeoxyribonuclease III [Polynucleobacter paneuropaeus]